MKTPLLLLSLLLSLKAAAQSDPQDEASTCCTSHYATDQFAAHSTQEIGAEYRRLRRRPCQACHRYGGNFHRLLKELGTRLDGAHRADVERIMGAPDERAQGRSIYYWRFRHDWLYFDFAADGTAQSGWYWAFE